MIRNRPKSVTDSRIHPSCLALRVPEISTHRLYMSLKPSLGSPHCDLNTLTFVPMSTSKPAQQNKRDNPNRANTIPSSERLQTTLATNHPHGSTGRSLAPPPPFPLHQLRLADAIDFDEGDLYLLVHRANKQLSEDVRFSLYSCKQRAAGAMRWAVKGEPPLMRTDHFPMQAREVLDLKRTATFKLCFAVVLKQNVAYSEAKFISSESATEPKKRPRTDWDSIERVITQEDKNIASLGLGSSLDYVRVTILRLKNAGILKFRNEGKFWEEIQQVEGKFAFGNVGPLPDRILLSRHLLYSE